MKEEDLWGGVIGNPVSHSWSPLIFSYLSEKERVPFSYKKIPLTERSLSPFFSFFRESKVFKGVNITLPFKQNAMDWVDGVSESAAQIGAINVATLRDGKVHGDNTDLIGIKRTLEEYQAKLAGEKVVLFGAGGAARAACYAAAELGAARLHVFNRTIEKAEQLVKSMSSYFPKCHFSAHAFERGELSREKGVSLYVNATPIGMMTQSRDKGFAMNASDSCERVSEETFFLSSLAADFAKNRGTLALDLIYSNTKTPFIKEAENLGLKAIDGVDMLIWQAFATWELWVKPLSDPMELKLRLRDILLNPRRESLC